MTIRRLFHQLLFNYFHRDRLVYNTTWEDPRIDRILLQLNSSSNVVAITSAGCNILDMALDTPARIHAVDQNPIQNHLLHLKKALITSSTYDDLFLFFGIGSHPHRKKVFRDIRHALPPQSAHYWQYHLDMFNPRGIRSSFYWHGTTGLFAWSFWLAAAFLPLNLKSLAAASFSSNNTTQQSYIYELAEPYLWSSFVQFLLQNPLVMSLLSIPPSQLSLIDQNEPSGFLFYLINKFKYVWSELPLHDNYFWHVYTFGSYTQQCCPSYLKKEYYEQLASTVANISIYDQSVAEFLIAHPGNYTHFVLLDHFDWLSSYNRKELLREWNLILANSSPGTKILYRSAGNGLELVPESIRSRLRLSSEPLDAIHLQDRVGTYGSVLLWEVL